AELRTLALGPRVKMAQIHLNLAVGCKFHVRAIHGTRRRTLEVDAFRVVAAAMARALELVFAGLPIGRAAQMRADRRDHENALGILHHPDAMVLLKFGIHAESEVGRKSDFELALRFVKCAGKEEAEKHQQIYG